jgi:large subunit ribosomal protein L4
MPNIDIITVTGEKAETVALPTAFTVEPKKALLHQAVLAYLANQRTSTAHTKTRGEVNGGGRKPWKQKGTGRARAGSSRSPLWIGGGITFGPRSNANFSKQLPAKMRQLAIRMALSTKAADNNIIVATDLTLNDVKTKFAAELYQKLAPEATSLLVVTGQMDEKLLQATSNLPTVAVTTVNDLNTYDILNFNKLLFTKEAFEMVEGKFGKAEKPAAKKTTKKSETVEAATSEA